MKVKALAEHINADDNFVPPIFDGFDHRMPARRTAVNKDRGKVAVQRGIDRLKKSFRRFNSAGARHKNVIVAGVQILSKARGGGRGNLAVGLLRVRLEDLSEMDGIEIAPAPGHRSAENYR